MDASIANALNNPNGDRDELPPEPASAQSFPLVLLKPGTRLPPIYIIHGLDGSVDKFADLVKRLQSDHPVYGIQAKGVNGLQEPFDRVEDMALYYVDAIKTLQPHGPYLLIGYSFGGLVALEVARFFSGQGERVDLLAMLAAYPDIRQLPLSLRIRVLARRGGHRAYEIGRMPVTEAVSYCNQRIRSRLRSSGNEDGSAPAMNRSSRRDAMRQKARTAIEQYHPHFYAGKIKFVQVEDDYYHPSNPQAVWGEFAAEFESETLPGDHLGIINEGFEALAPVLSRYLEEACNEKSSEK